MKLPTIKNETATKAAFLLQFIAHWSLNERINLNAKDLQKLLPFMTDNQIRYSLKKLLEIGFIEVDEDRSMRSFLDKTKRYKLTKIGEKETVVQGGGK